MGDFASPFKQPPPAPSKSNLPTLYYGLAVIATAALLLALYNLLIVRWCTQSNQIQRAPRRRSLLVEMPTSQSCENPNRNLSSFKYKKGVAAEEQGVELNDCECAVCLSAFEEGEEVRKLPRCKHSFHAACIDMWLYSHSDCPLCRSPVGWLCQQHVVYTQEENSQENVQ